MKFSCLKCGERNSSRKLKSLRFLVDCLQTCESSSHLTHLWEKLPLHHGEQNLHELVGNSEGQLNINTRYRSDL
jgi:hypothetical protein